jgi:hypothetical protein
MAAAKSHPSLGRLILGWVGVNLLRGLPRRGEVVEAVEAPRAERDKSENFQSVLPYSSNDVNDLLDLLMNIVADSQFWNRLVAFSI